MTWDGQSECGYSNKLLCSFPSQQSRPGRHNTETERRGVLHSFLCSKNNFPFSLLFWATSNLKYAVFAWNLLSTSLWSCLSKVRQHALPGYTVFVGACLGSGDKTIASPLPDQTVQNLTCMHAPGGSNFTFGPSLYACANQILNRRTDLQTSVDFLSEIPSTMHMQFSMTHLQYVHRGVKVQIGLSPWKRSGGEVTMKMSGGTAKV